ncbi:ATP-binding protein [Legionella bozemanae]|uniref:GAF domain-containing sensor histidine kinase n=1 Tax=Legionella bozemanae TaxID=447 RepID=UPI00399C74AA
MMVSLQKESPEIEQFFLGIIDTAIAISEADFGNIQLINLATQKLKIVAQCGFPQYWLDHWENVSKGQSSCGKTLEYRERIIVEDICQSPFFEGKDLEIQLKAGIRAVQSTPLINRAGKIIGVFSTHYKRPFKPDIRILRLLDLLARQVADSIEQIELQQKLKKREEELKRAVSIREEFISMISHELKTPLTGLKIATQLGQRLMEQEKLTESKLSKLFDTWLEELGTFENLIGTMLDVTIISQGRLSFNCRELDLNDVIMKIAERFYNQVSYQGMSLIGYWDPYRIEQIMTNLVANGIKYGREKPIEVELFAVDAENFKLIVKDYGFGIAPEDKERIFNKFERINNTDAVSGTGLGLYIVKQIVTAQDGKIDLESKIGSGSTFTITLPLHASQKSNK